MINKKAFSLIEMQISLIIASILVLTVGVLSSIAMGTSSQLRKEAEIFNELMYSFKFMQKGMRETGACIIAPTTSPWVSSKLECDDVAYGVYFDSVTNIRELVYLEDKLDDTDREVLFFVPGPTPDLDLNLTLNSDLITATITGEKDDTPFNLSTTIKKR